MPSVSVSVTDDDTAGQPGQAEPGSVTVSAADPVVVSEGSSATYTVVLDAEPTDNVAIAISSDNADVTAQPSSLTFTHGQLADGPDRDPPHRPGRRRGG